MRILQLTPGTGNFHCGSCLRDHAFINALNGMGHDVRIVPMYLPLVTEEPLPDDVPLFFGGVNVFLQTKYAAFRRTPRWFDRWFDSTALLTGVAKRMGMTKPRQLGEMTLASFQADRGPQRKEVERLVDWVRDHGKPDLVILSNCLLAGLARPLRAALDRPVVCTLQGEDTFLDDLPEPYHTQCWDLLRECSGHVDLAIAVSEYHAGIMRDRLDCEVRVVHNGIDLDGYEPRVVAPAPPVIGFLARMCRVKGLDTLVDAFVELAHPTARLRVVGTCMPSDEPFVEEQKRKLDAAGLGERCGFHPNVPRSEKIELLRGMTLLSVPAVYGESFGLYVIEANACGVPVLQPRHAAFPELLEITGGGRLFEPGSLRAALDRALAEPEAMEELGRAGAGKVREHFSIEVASRRLLDAIGSTRSGD